MNEEETKLKQYWIELKQPIEKLDIKIIEGWETEWDTQLDETNVIQFLLDRYDNPLLFLENFFKNKHSPF